MANRYFVTELPRPGPLRLDGELSHHLGRVLRARPGDRVVLGDGRGGTADAAVTAVGKHAVEVDVTAVHGAAPARPHVLLAFAPPRQQRTDWLLEHGTEVGIAGFQPLWTARTRPQGERLERWLKIVRAAAGQCDRAWLPELLPAMELTTWLRSDAVPAARVLADPAGAPLTDGVAAERVALLVGPEGGFDADERQAIAAAGFVPRGLGPHILRTETAAVVGAAMLLANAVAG
ncbi:MAG: 16S rRNA (uracil(1498)-N(3))-methyltransferase [Planctomycetes bacterium]|jgi:16S rRNA (uracil1498-N3)-methyltransferase|nr:16S rRNA (uracil(1498)-N(3))-methyltransferase [Planctomycetota bacterium]